MGDDVENKEGQRAGDAAFFEAIDGFLHHKKGPLSADALALLEAFLTNTPTVACATSGEEDAARSPLPLCCRSLTRMFGDFVEAESIPLQPYPALTSATESQVRAHNATTELGVKKSAEASVREDAASESDLAACLDALIPPGLSHDDAAFLKTAALPASSATHRAGKNNGATATEPSHASRPTTTETSTTTATMAAPHDAKLKTDGSPSKEPSMTKEHMSWLAVVRLTALLSRMPPPADSGSHVGLKDAMLLREALWFLSMFGLLPYAQQSLLTQPHLQFSSSAAVGQLAALSKTLCKHKSGGERRLFFVSAQVLLACNSVFRQFGETIAADLVSALLQLAFHPLSPEEEEDGPVLAATRANGHRTAPTHSYQTVTVRLERATTPAQAVDAVSELQQQSHHSAPSERACDGGAPQNTLTDEERDFCKRLLIDVLTRVLTPRSALETLFQIATPPPARPRPQWVQPLVQVMISRVLMAGGVASLLSMLLSEADEIKNPATTTLMWQRAHQTAMILSVTDTHTLFTKKDYWHALYPQFIELLLLKFKPLSPLPDSPANLEAAAPANAGDSPASSEDDQRQDLVRLTLSAQRALCLAIFAHYETHPVEALTLYFHKVLHPFILYSAHTHAEAPALGRDASVVHATPAGVNAFEVEKALYLAHSTFAVHAHRPSVIEILTPHFIAVLALGFTAERSKSHLWQRVRELISVYLLTSNNTSCVSILAQALTFTPSQAAYEFRASALGGVALSPMQPRSPPEHPPAEGAGSSVDDLLFVDFVVAQMKDALAPADNTSGAASRHSIPAKSSLFMSVLTEYLSHLGQSGALTTTTPEVFMRTGHVLEAMFANLAPEILKDVGQGLRLVKTLLGFPWSHSFSTGLSILEMMLSGILKIPRQEWYLLDSMLPLIEAFATQEDESDRGDGRQPNATHPSKPLIEVVSSSESNRVGEHSRVHGSRGSCSYTPNHHDTSDHHAHHPPLGRTGSVSDSEDSSSSPPSSSADARARAKKLLISIRTRAATWSGLGAEARKYEKDTATGQVPDSLQKIMTLINDPLLPVRAHGIMRLRREISQNKSSVREHLGYVMGVVSTSLSDPDSYLYLAAIDALVALSVAFPLRILPQIIDEFRDETKSVTVRLNIGQGLANVTRRFGKVLPKYVHMILPTLLELSRAGDVDIRASCLSILAHVCGQLGPGIHAVVNEVVHCVCQLAFDAEDRVRRGAVVVISAIVSGLGTEGFGVIGAHVSVLEDVCARVSSRDVDPVTRYHAGEALAAMASLATDLLTPTAPERIRI